MLSAWCGCWIAGELHRVAVSTVEAESLRDVVRAREDLRGDLMSARHRVSKLLFRHDVRFRWKGAQLDSAACAVVVDGALRSARDASGV
jgi:hypothetical protein